MQTINREEVQALQEETSQILVTGNEVAVITSTEDEARAVEFLARVKRQFKTVDEKRKAYVKPLKDVIDTINADFKAILEPLEQVEVIVKRGMTTYRSQEEFKAREALRIEAERKAKEAVNEIRKDGLTDDNLERAQEAGKALATANEEAPRTVNTQTGGASFRKDWKFEITDASKLPNDIKKEVLEIALTKGLFDQVIRGRIKLGVREIAGVRMWEEATPIIRS